MYVNVQLHYYCNYTICMCYIATKHPEIFHSYDVWHKSKNLRKALMKVNTDIIDGIISSIISLMVLFQAGNIKGMNKLHDWSGNIVNHLWFCSRTCDEDLDTLKVYKQHMHIYMYYSFVEEMVILAASCYW